MKKKLFMTKITCFVTTFSNPQGSGVYAIAESLIIPEIHFIAWVSCLEIDIKRHF